MCSDSRIPEIVALGEFDTLNCLRTFPHIPQDAACLFLFAGRMRRFDLVDAKSIGLTLGQGSLKFFRKFRFALLAGLLWSF